MSLYNIDCTSSRDVSNAGVGGLCTMPWQQINKYRLVNPGAGDEVVLVGRCSIS